MAHPLPNEKEHFSSLQEQSFTIDSDIWGFIYHRIVDDISAINFYCSRSLSPRQPVPSADVQKILFYARDISNVSRIITSASADELAFPQFKKSLPLHPIIRELFSHQVGNDIYAIELMAEDAVDPGAAASLDSSVAEKIIAHCRSIKEFMERLRDVTYRKVGEGLIRESEKKFRNLYDSFTYGLLRTDMRGRIVEFNRAFQEMLGFSREELWVMRYAQLVSLLSLDKEQSILEQVFATGYSEEVTEEYVRKDSGRMQVAVKKWLIYDEQQQPSGMWVICRDLSGKEKSEQKILAEAVECKDLLDKMGDGVTLSDRSGRFEVFNRRMSEITGYTMDDANTCGDFSLLLYPDPLQRANALAGVEAVARDGSLPEIETVIQAKDKSRKSLLVTTSLVRYKNREMFLSIYHDMTGKSQLEHANRCLVSFPEMDPSPVLELDAAGRIVYANPAAKKIISREEDKRIFLAHLDTVLRVMERTLEKCFTREVQVEERWFSQVISYMAETRHIRIYSFDSTERKKAELAKSDALRQWKVTFDAIEDAICILNLEGKIVKCNKEMLRMLGKQPWDVLGNRCAEMLHESGSPPQNCPLARMKQSLVRETQEIREGNRWLQVTVDPVFDEQHRLVNAVHIIRDITPLKEATDKILFERDRSRQYFEHAGVMFLVLDLDGTILQINRTGCEILGYDAGSLQGKNWIHSFLPQRLRNEVQKVFDGLMLGESKIFGQYENPVLTSSGAERVILWHNVALKDEAGNITAILSSGQDITERKKAEMALRESEKEIKHLVDTANSIIIRWKPDGKLIFVNEYGLKAFGYKKEELLGRDVSILVPRVDTAGRSLENLVKDIVEYPQDFVLSENENVKNNGERFWVVWTNKAIQDKEGKLKEILAMGIDITERKKAEEKITHLNRQLAEKNKGLQELTLTDSQTGLYNHRYFSAHIEMEFNRAHRYFQPLSVMMVDLDYFKSINDVYGHAFGDLVLRQFSRQLRRFVRSYDTLIRLGGEEFVVICPQTPMEASVNLGQRILENINLYRFGNKKNSVTLKLSIAVASYPQDQVRNGQGLVELADQILRKVKEAGGNRIFCSRDTGQDKDQRSESSADVLSLQEKLDGLTRRANQSLIEAVFAFAKTVEAKDQYTGEHVGSAVQYAKSIARQMSMMGQDIEQVGQAAMLHDLGKIGVPERVLHKKGRLTKEEFAQIRRHPEIGATILRPVQALNHLIPAILHHHERWDGKGYPDKLSGKEIPQKARIIAIADVFQALVSDRPYRKKAYTKVEAMHIIEEGAGRQFCPMTVKAFMAAMQG